MRIDPDVLDVLAICGCVWLLLTAAGLFLFLRGKGHQAAASGDHLLAIIRWRDADDEAEADQ